MERQIYDFHAVKRLLYLSPDGIEIDAVEFFLLKKLMRLQAFRAFLFCQGIDARDKFRCNQVVFLLYLQHSFLTSS